MGRAMLPRVLLLASLAAPQPPAQQPEPGAPAVDPAVLAAPAPVADLTAWADAIAPGAAELTFEAIPWLPTFADGVLAAAAQDRPLLFWAMNGHPLGCT